MFCKSLVFLYSFCIAFYLLTFPPAECKQTSRKEGEKKKGSQAGCCLKAEEGNLPKFQRQDLRVGSKKGNSFQQVHCRLDHFKIISTKWGEFPGGWDCKRKCTFGYKFVAREPVQSLSCLHGRHTLNWFFDSCGSWQISCTQARKPKGAGCIKPLWELFRSVNRFCCFKTLWFKLGLNQTKFWFKDFKMSWESKCEWLRITLENIFHVLIFSVWCFWVPPGNA